jgi:hypothetical protein
VRAVRTAARAPQPIVGNRGHVIARDRAVEDPLGRALGRVVQRRGAGQDAPPAQPAIAAPRLGAQQVQRTLKVGGTALPPGATQGGLDGQLRVAIAKRKVAPGGTLGKETLPTPAVYKPKLAEAHTSPTDYDLDTDAGVTALVTFVGGSIAPRATPTPPSSSSSSSSSSSGTPATGAAATPAPTPAPAPVARTGRRQRPMKEPKVGTAYHHLWSAGFVREGLGSTWWRPLRAKDTVFGAGTPMHMTVVADGVLAGSSGSEHTRPASQVREACLLDWHVTAEGPTPKDNRHQYYVNDRPAAARGAKRALGDNAAAKTEALGYINAIR